MELEQREWLGSVPDLGDVDVVDDLVPDELRRDILRLVRKPIWAYGWKSVKSEDRFSFWHAHFAGGDKESRQGCLAELAANEAARPIHELWECLSQTVLAGHEPLRVYANAHTYGVEGYVHTDNADKENYFTVVYYAHGIWHPNWSGETAFVVPETGDITHAVYPRPGRLVVFRGATPHVARSPSRDCPELRITVVFKTQLAQ
ncbi:2OG-Fe(II) oxygenase [Stenotrophomonas maltophilia group sp. Smal35]|uniref:2OG-Fe(II) oxygenase n=1 Tax=Stenotrophomonas maltophilia group sp. Smal35 TaxID=3377163 RepID=UPI002556516B|nr:2OG-Fe(II) oxygenase [Stenotrophomonas maltophilia]